jgi:hypothetical protein
MKSHKLTFLITALFLGFGYLTLSSSSSGVTGVSSTGCGGPTCHATGATTLNLTGVPTTGFVPGDTYTLTLTLTNTTKSNAGFNLSVSDGVLSNAPLNTNIISSGLEIHHTSPQPLGSGTINWVFNWTAPTTATAVTFNIAGNAVNGNTMSSGDEWSTLTKNYNAVGVSAPTILFALVGSTSLNSATINGSVNANGADASVSVQYGLTTAYGSAIATNPNLVTGTSNTNVLGTLIGLTPGTTYHYRIAATNSVGTTYSPDNTFMTLFPLTIGDIAQSDIKFFPNPVQSELICQTTKNYRNTNFSVYSLDGKLSVIPVKFIGNGEYRLDTHQLSAGNYVLKVNADEQTYSYLFTKK